MPCSILRTHSRPAVLRGVMLKPFTHFPCFSDGIPSSFSLELLEPCSFVLLRTMYRQELFAGTTSNFDSYVAQRRRPEGQN